MHNLIPLHIADRRQSDAKPQMRSGSKSNSRQAIQELERAWLRALENGRRLSLSQIAREAGLSDTTLTRMFHKGYSGTLSTMTRKRLCETYGVPTPEEWEAAGRPPVGGLAEEAVPYQPGRGDADTDAAVRALLHGRKGVDAMVLKTRSLEDAGYLPGDVVILDTTLPAKDRDLVCAQVYEAGGATTVWRRYDAPYITDLTRNPDARKAPELVDGKRVFIVGVVVGMVRRKPLAA